MQRKLLGAPLLAAMVALAACGGGDDKEAAKDDSSTSTAVTEPGGAAPGDGATGGAGGPATSAPGSGAGAGAGAQGGSGSTAPSSPGGQSSTASTAAPGETPPTPLEFTLGSPCIRAGSEQTITIKAPAGGGVGYDSYYSDGKSGISKDFYGGNAGKVMPESGSWTDTWRVSATAPPGKVKVLVQAVKMGMKATTQEQFYDLVGPTGSCG